MKFRSLGTNAAWGFYAEGRCEGHSSGSRRLEDNGNLKLKDMERECNSKFTIVVQG